MECFPLLIVLGPTASGKTKLAVQLAAELHGEIVSADSRQVFRGMDIGTGKDLAEYEFAGRKIPYHLIDIRQAGEKYDVNSFRTDFYDAYELIVAKGNQPILCGGTGMYIHSLLQNHNFTSIPINPVLRSRLLEQSIEELQRTLLAFPAKYTEHADQSTKKRLIRAIEIAFYLQSGGQVEDKREKLNAIVIGLTEEIDSRRKKIADRLVSRFDQGLIDEVENLMLSGVPEEVLTFYGLEYKLVVSYLKHHISLTELKECLFNNICQYAKRQMTFFRKMEKDGIKIHWYQADRSTTEIVNLVLSDHGKGLALSDPDH